MENQKIVEPEIDKNRGLSAKKKKKRIKKDYEQIKPIIEEGEKIIKKEGKKLDGCLTTVLRIVKHVHYIYHTFKILHLSHRFVKWML